MILISINKLDGAMNGRLFLLLKINPTYQISRWKGICKAVESPDAGELLHYLHEPDCL